MRALGILLSLSLAFAAQAAAAAEVPVGGKRMRLSLLPLAAPADEAEAARRIEAILSSVLAGMPGVELLPLEAAPPARVAEVQALLERCGDQPDCRLRIGRLLGSQVLVFGAVSDAAAGVLLDLEFFEVASASVMRKISRSLLGGEERRRCSLEACLTEVLFPERLRGDIELELEPAGARVYLDGQLVIPKAAERERLSGLHAASHTLRVSRDGYADFYAIVQVPYKDATRLRVRMRPAGEKPAGNIPGSRGQLERDPWSIAPEAAWYEHWWVWLVVGGVVAGGVTAGVLLGR